MDKLEEITQKCVERTCGIDFIITGEEQGFYTDKGFYLPKRCKDCRAKRRIEKEERLAKAENEN